MQNETPAPPPAQPASATQEPTGATAEPTVNGIMQNDAPSSLTQIVLDVLAALPSLL